MTLSSIVILACLLVSGCLHYSVAIANPLLSAISKTTPTEKTLSSNLESNDELLLLRSALAQKMIIEIRYFCEQAPKRGNCVKPVTRLTPSLARLIASSKVGGVILFAENLVDRQQIITLNYDLQQAARAANIAPLFIAIDQEGGRVARLPDDVSTQFSGNMAIGATWDKYQSYFATQVGMAIAMELKPLGINVNFAPSLDVNVNPKNPIINVRAFSQFPHVVSRQGAAMVEAMQSAGVMSAVKHFPGHGDTHIDSHSGLPQVNHSKQQITEVDIFPFADVIATSKPAMVMTAHIQYPHLDNSKILNKRGDKITVPATLSKKILSEVLRKELKFEGVIVTDALDMAGISQFFSVENAIKHTFAAGADIALMPFTIRTPDDIDAFNELLDKLANDYLTNRSLQAMLWKSIERIEGLKQHFNIQQFTHSPLAEQLSKSNSSNMKKHSLLAAELARSAITLHSKKIELPLNYQQRWLAFMPDTLRCMSLVQSIKSIQKTTTINCFSLTSDSWSLSDLQQYDGVIVGDLSPQQGLYEMKNMENVAVSAFRPFQQQQQLIKHVLTYAKQANKTSVAIALRSPYVLNKYQHITDVTLASYSYQVSLLSAAFSPTPKKISSLRVSNVKSYDFDAIAELLFGQVISTGKLPVTLY